MVKRIAITIAVTLWFVLPAQATMNLIGREMFNGLGTLTSGSPGSFNSISSGTFYKKPGGPYVSGGSPYSADFNAAQATTMGVFTATSTNQFACAWLFIKSAPGAPGNEMVYLTASDFRTFRWEARTAGLYYGIKTTDMRPLTNIAYGQWIWVGVATKFVSGTSHDAKFYYKLPGQAMVEAGSFTNINGGSATLNNARFGAQGAANQYVNGRIGAASYYRFTSTDFSDIAYPTDVIEPATGLSWYVNPSTGSDSNDGATSGTAWQTSTKIQTETSTCGLFPAASYNAGDTLYIDTSGSNLEMAHPVGLTFQTDGLRVMAAPGQRFWRVTGAQTLTNASFTATTGTANVYQVGLGGGTTNTSIVAWEDEKWMNHPNGATLVSVTNSLDTVPGSFWTDSTNLYIHPFASSNPTSDGKVYTRSFNRFAGSIIGIQCNNFWFADFHGGKSTLCVSTNGDAVGSYVVGVGTPGGGTSVITNCFTYYGSKHGLGLVGDADNSTLTVVDCVSEQCSPYGSQSPWVSFMASATKTNNVHHYVRCVTDKMMGLIGSTAGQDSLQTVFVSHNGTGVGTQFKSMDFTDCWMNGTISVSVATNSTITGGRFHGVQLRSYNTLLDRVHINKFGVDNEQTNTSSVTIRSCLFTPNQNLIAGEWGGMVVRQTELIEGCTFDLSAVGNSDAATKALLVRSGASTLTYRNNMLIIPPAKSYTLFGSFVNTDTIVATNNVYRLGSGNWIARSYNDGATTADRTFAQWQTLTFDTGSVNQDPCLSANYRPYSKTPCWTAGAELGPMADITGKIFQSRRTAGAYEYTTPPLVPFRK